MPDYCAPLPQGVHPRTGGEHFLRWAGVAEVAGSSPHGRGTPYLSRKNLRTPRFIPARAGNTFVLMSVSGSASVHPRTGGEHCSSSHSSPHVSGSSPHGRGTLYGDRNEVSGKRFIPARAGNTAHQTPKPVSGTVHPRTGGEHPRNRRISAARFGSSPHGRGTQLRETGREMDRRFIPARAGNTAASSGFQLIVAVHPRTGGEHPVVATASCHSDGSSPHGRGTLADVRSRVRRIRFIPARAGNTATFSISHQCLPVHPRTGGEHVPAPMRVRNAVGSSPHGRGTRYSGIGDWIELRFIPARAGNTLQEKETRLRAAVHPRTGGEHDADALKSVSTTGSSPHGRGTHRTKCGCAPLRRFIPARAGNTSYQVRVRAVTAVHPRTGGEHVALPEKLTLNGGSSPHGRGTLPRPRSCSSEFRFIPARAGNTLFDIEASRD